MREKNTMSNINKNNLNITKIFPTTNITHLFPLTPHTIHFNTSQPLTEQQIFKLNFFIDELLFDEENEEDIPEFTTEVLQIIINS